ncbi:MAG: tRNA (adenosine(37)-N6)-threonylcarbamoyltransferase complex ATPase subunit type 1 TsaE, partial [Hyphomicrobium sp.]
MTASHTIPGIRESDLPRLAEDIAFATRPGDVIALRGDLGAGKTTLARAIIHALGCDEREEIPSPTFTLVQTYATRRMPVAHFDLYRLNAASEIEELGLDLALKRGIALIEWPERASGTLPASRLEILLEDESGRSAREESATRRVSLMGEGDWAARLPRLVAMRKLMATGGLESEASRLGYLQGDASVRRYARITRAPGAGAILMDWARQPDGPAIRNGLPYSRIAHLAEDVRPFVAVAAALRALGLSVPGIYAQDLDRGFLLIEDLGDRVFGNEVESGAADQALLWRTAAETLAALSVVVPPSVLPVGDGTEHRLPAYDRGALSIETELLLDWHWPALHGSPVPDDARAEFLSQWGVVFDRLAALP